jgi:hypothetical protein
LRNDAVSTFEPRARQPQAVAVPNPLLVKNVTGTNETSPRQAAGYRGVFIDIAKFPTLTGVIKTTNSPPIWVIAPYGLGQVTRILQRVLKGEKAPV